MSASQPDGDERDVIPVSEEGMSVSDKMLEIMNDEYEATSKSGISSYIDTLPYGLLKMILAAGDQLVSCILYLGVSCIYLVSCIFGSTVALQAT